MFKDELLSTTSLQKRRALISAQQFSIVIATSNTTNTATINWVDTAHAFIIIGGLHTASSLGSTANATCVLTNATTVTATRASSDASNTLTVTGTVVWFAPSVVKSVQQGSISVGSAATSNTATINAVDTTRSVVLFLGNNPTDSSGYTPSTDWLRLTLTNATTVTADKNATGNNTLVEYVVVEFQPGAVTQVQNVSATASDSNASFTATLSPVVDMNRSVVLYAGIKSAAVTASAAYTLQLTANNTVTFARGGTATSTRTINCWVVEFAHWVIRGIRRGTISESSGSSATATIPWTDPAYAWCHWLGNESSVGTIGVLDMTMTFTNPTTITQNRQTSTSSTTVAGYEVAWFN